jgi:hypothetical protein
VKSWEDKWKSQTKKDGQEIKDKIGEDATVSIFDVYLIISLILFVDLNTYVYHSHTQL